MLLAFLAIPALALQVKTPIVVKIKQTVIDKHPQIRSIPSCFIANDPKDYCKKGRDGPFSHDQVTEVIRLLKEINQCQALNDPRLREWCDPRPQPVQKQKPSMPRPQPVQKQKPSAKESPRATERKEDGHAAKPGKRHSRRFQAAAADCQSLTHHSDREDCNKKIGNCEALTHHSDREDCIKKRVQDYADE